jgi:hypothetical protein
VTSGGDFDYSSYKRASETDYSSSAYTSRYSSQSSDYSSAPSPGGTSYGGYTPLQPGGYQSKYGGAARQGFMAMRSKTLGNDYGISYDSPASPGGSAFSSRFLNKVRQEGGDAELKSPKARDKPFKSRFLRSSFDSSDYGASSSASSYSSRFMKSHSVDISTSSSGIGSSFSSSSDTASKEISTEAGSADMSRAAECAE